MLLISTGPLAGKERDIDPIGNDAPQKLVASEPGQRVLEGEPKTAVRNSGPDRFYALPFETEDAKRRLTARIEERVSKAKAERDPDYDAEFERLGISPKAAEMIKDHLWKLGRASNEVMAYQQQFLKAQADYDRMMRKILTPEGYAQYRRFEDRLAANSEIEKLKSFFQKKGSALSEEASSEIRRLLLDTRAFTFEFLHGPYDPMPDVGYGFESGIASINDDIARIRDAKARLGPQLGTSNLPADVRTRVGEYFDDRVKECEGRIENLKRRIESRDALGEPSSVHESR